MAWDEPATTNLSNRPHLVVLGAGASRAACPDGDANGNFVPLTSELADVIGVREDLDKLDLDADDFELAYDKLSRDTSNVDLRQRIDHDLRAYFKNLKLPDHPTIYDWLVWSLRSKDMIASFNWDPFLYQALERNPATRDFGPHWEFLHGCAAMNMCHEHKTYIVDGYPCSQCAEIPPPMQILYPVQDKDYTSEPYIRNGWNNLKRAMKHAYMVTIFGYSAPRTDTAAHQMFFEAWLEQRSPQFSQIEFINTAPREEIEAAWDEILSSGELGSVHYHIHKSFQDSFLFRYPRRTCEHLYSASIQLNPFRNNSFPSDLTLDDLQQWGQQLVDAESAVGEEGEITDDPIVWPPQ